MRKSYRETIAGEIRALEQKQLGSLDILLSHCRKEYNSGNLRQARLDLDEIYNLLAQTA